MTSARESSNAEKKDWLSLTRWIVRSPNPLGDACMAMPAVRALTNAPMVPTVRMRALASGRGYYLLGSDGAVYSFGTAKFFGSAPGINAVDLMVAN